MILRVIYGGAKTRTPVNVRLPSGKIFVCEMRDPHRRHITQADITSNILDAVLDAVRAGRQRGRLLGGGHVCNVDIHDHLVASMEALS